MARSEQNGILVDEISGEIAFPIPDFYDGQCIRQD
jgi:hypothetical protein